MRTTWNSISFNQGDSWGYNRKVEKLIGCSLTGLWNNIYLPNQVREFLSMNPTCSVLLCKARIHFQETLTNRWRFIKEDVIRWISKNFPAQSIRGDLITKLYSAVDFAFKFKSVRWMQVSRSSISCHLSCDHAYMSLYSHLWSCIMSKCDGQQFWVITYDQSKGTWAYNSIWKISLHPLHRNRLWGKWSINYHCSGQIWQCRLAIKSDIQIYQETE